MKAITPLNHMLHANGRPEVLLLLSVSIAMLVLANFWRCYAMLSGVVSRLGGQYPWMAHEL